MKRSVMKFGGSSLASIEKINHVAGLVIQHAINHQVVVVVSAMMGETDRLVGLGQAVFDHDEPNREYDQLISNGENVTAALVALAIQKRGHQAISFTGWQAGIQTTSEPQNAQIIACDTQCIQQAFDEGKIPIVTGFQGVANGTVTTLSRGGSDLTAIALAHSLKAELCWIYTDVKGIYPVDPRIMPEAAVLKQLDFHTLSKISARGTKVVQSQAADYAMKYQQPIRVCHSERPDLGTLVGTEDVAHPPIISHCSDITLLQCNKDSLPSTFDHLETVGLFQSAHMGRCHAFKASAKTLSQMIRKTQIQEQVMVIDGHWSLITITYHKQFPQKSFLDALLKKSINSYSSAGHLVLSFIVPKSRVVSHINQIYNIISRFDEEMAASHCKP